MSWVLFAGNAVCKKEYRDILYKETSGRLEIPMACKDSKLIKGTMSPQAHGRVDEKHFEIVGPTFSNTVGKFRKLFSSV